MNYYTTTRVPLAEIDPKSIEHIHRAGRVLDDDDKSNDKDHTFNSAV